ncbi:GbsR/MarR family transcriptional regulator [Pedobacter sp. SYP-B3415]|uniref:GbsR/MarR family transcriptional regulator n=1 Tax=Pedobacter sp. SYP-B3415 TaxID=2496641 RepID=UPI001F1023FE|nr:MarR family transcriptional regulator [Pedobacter sp. SYP-B3415]
MLLLFMELAEAKQKFIDTWGRLGSEWGINRTMAQVHALLLVSPDPLSAEEVMSQLSISRGNANMTLRDLISWGLVEKQHRPGERKEYFFADKDAWNIARQVAKERKKRELEPMLRVLNELAEVEGDSKDPHFKTFQSSVKDIRALAQNANKTIDTMVRAEENWFWSTFFKLFK